MECMDLHVWDHDAFLSQILLSDLPLGLVLIRQKALVGQLPGNHKVYKILKIAVIPLSEEEPLDLELEVSQREIYVGVDYIV